MTRAKPSLKRLRRAAARQQMAASHAPEHSAVCTRTARGPSGDGATDPREGVCVGSRPRDDTSQKQPATAET